MNEMTLINYQLSRQSFKCHKSDRRSPYILLSLKPLSVETRKLRRC